MIVEREHLFLIARTEAHTTQKDPGESLLTGYWSSHSANPKGAGKGETTAFFREMS